MTTEHEKDMTETLQRIIAEYPSVGDLVRASEVFKAGVEAQRKLEEDYARVVQAALDSQAQIAYMQQHGYMAPPRIYIAGIPEPGSSFRPNVITQETPETAFCYQAPQHRIPFTADPLAARYAHGYQED